MYNYVYVYVESDRKCWVERGERIGKRPQDGNRTCFATSAIALYIYWRTNHEVIGTDSNYVLKQNRFL